MLLTIAILALISVILSILGHLNNHSNLEFDLIVGAILVIASWGCSTTVGIVALCILIFIGLVGLLINDG